MVRGLVNMGGEGLEEVVSGFADPVLQGIYNGKTLNENYSTLNLNDILREGAVGMLLGGLGGTVNMAQTGYGTTDGRGLSTPYSDLLREKQLYTPYADALSNKNSSQLGAEYRAEIPQNIEMPHVPLIELSMSDLAEEYGGNLPAKGNYGRKEAIGRARIRLGLNEIEAAYIPASNVTRNGDEYILKITKSSLNKMLSPAGGGDVPVESLLVMDNLERIANNGVYYRSEGDRKGRDQILGIDHLMTTVYIDGTPMVVDIRVRVVQIGEGNRKDNVLYYFTPEEISIKKESGSASAAERPAFRGEASPLSISRIAQGHGESKGKSTDATGAASINHPEHLRYQELLRKYLDGNITEEEGEELWRLGRIWG